MKKNCKSGGRLLAMVLVMTWALDCFGVGVDATSERLSCVGSGVSPKITETRAGDKVWDVSGFSMCRGRDLVACYGDSVYSETINGHRVDYKIMGDSIKLCTIQSPMARIDHIDCPAFPSGYSNTMCSHFTGRIVCFNDELGAVYGTVTRSYDERGLFVGFEGDTICDVNRITDVFDIVLHFDVTEEAVRIERSRWFSAESELPFAISERVSSRDSVGKYVENSATFSTVSSDELKQIKDKEDKSTTNKDDEILRMLDSIEVSGMDDVLKIDGILVDDHVLNVDIIDTAGNHFGIKKCESLPATMSLSGLLPGNYIVVLSVTTRPELTVKRMFVRL